MPSAAAAKQADADGEAEPVAKKAKAAGESRTHSSSSD